MLNRRTGPQPISTTRSSGFSASKPRPVRPRHRISDDGAPDPGGTAEPRLRGGRIHLFVEQLTSIHEAQSRIEFRFR